MIGQTIGPYTVLAKVGAGGMGEVYRAVDLRLKRDVAIKVLPAEVARDPDRLARFQREAELLAAMDHPNIARVFGLEVTDGRHALVMELVDGPTLAERIGEGALSLDSAVRIATQIADALEAAHERGVVHRDLKPANVKVRRDGVVKVLDFGLAKSLQPPGPASTGGLTDSPTATSPAHLTASGVVLGTAAYMAPEQAKGDDIGRPADVWAFGCVLYEMLVGAAPFRGGSVAEVIGEVLKSEPEWSRLPSGTPENVRRLLRRCFVKDPRKRLQHVGDARLELLDTTLATPQPTPAAGWPRRRWLPWVVATGASAAALALGLRTPPPIAQERQVTRLDLSLPAGVEASTVSSPSASLSPDGTRIVFTAQAEGFRRLYVRNLNESEARMLVATDSSSQCYFSPDGSAVAFVSSDRTVRRVTLADGSTNVLARGVDRNFGVTWNADGQVVFVKDGTLHQIPGGGGTAQQVSRLESQAGELFHAWPMRVPGSSQLLFTVVTGATRDAHRIDAVDPRSGERHTVVDIGSFPMVAAEGPLVFYRDGALMAAPLDRTRMTVSGPAVRVLDDVALDNLGAPLASLSASGALIYLSNASVARRLVAVTRAGFATPLGEPRAYDYPRLSPDGRHVVTYIAGDIWRLDIARSTLTRVTAQAAVGNSYAVWTPDGGRIVYRTATGLRIGSASGGASTAIPNTFATDFPQGVAPDGKTLVFMRQTAEASADAYVLSLDGSPAPRALFSTPAYEGGGVLSPDGRWLAYASDESGRYEVFVRSYPDTSRKWPVSTEGGTQPRWSPDGKELFYRLGTRFFAVPIAGSAEAVLGRPTVLFDRQFRMGSGLTLAEYDVAHDGRFIMTESTSQGGRFNLILNWTEELKRLTAGREDAFRERSVR